jgi:hypothetical protein
VCSKLFLCETRSAFSHQLWFPNAAWKPEEKLSHQ